MQEGSLRGARGSNVTINCGRFDPSELHRITLHYPVVNGIVGISKELADSHS